MIIGFLIEDRAALLMCSLTGNSFCSPSRAHLFADIEINSLQRFQGLLELSATSLTTFDHESLKTFSSVRTISVRNADAWVTPGILSSLLFLPLLEPFPHVKDFRIDSLTFPDYPGVETFPVLPTPPLYVGRHVEGEVGRRFGVPHRGAPTTESFAGSPNSPALPEFSITNLKTLSLSNCQAPSLRWLLRYVSYFQDLESLSLTDFTWRSTDGENTDQSPILQCSIFRQSRGIPQLTLEVNSTPPVASAPRLLFESLSGGLRILRLMHIDMILSLGQLTVYVF